MDHGAKSTRMNSNKITVYTVISRNKVTGFEFEAVQKKLIEKTPPHFW